MGSIVHFLTHGGAELLLLVGGTVYGWFAKKDKRLTKILDLARMAFYAVEGLARGAGWTGAAKLQRFMELFTRAAEQAGLSLSDADLAMVKRAVSAWSKASGPTQPSNTKGTSR